MLKDILLLVIANACWGSGDVAAKLTFSQMSPEASAWIRYLLASAALMPILWAQRSKIPRTIAGILPFIILGACGFCINLIFNYQGLKLAPASHGTTIRMCESLFILLLSAVLLRERIGKKALFGFAFGIAGLVLVLDIDFNNLSLFKSGYRLGDLLILTGVFVEAFNTALGKRALEKSGPVFTVALSCLLGWLLLSLFYGPAVVMELAQKCPAPGALAACVYLGLCSTALAFSLYYLVLSRRDSYIVGMSLMIQPVIGIPLAAAVFNEPVTAGFLAGTVLILAGVYITFGKKPAPTG